MRNVMYEEADIRKETTLGQCGWGFFPHSLTITSYRGTLFLLGHCVYSI